MYKINNIIFNISSIENSPDHSESFDQKNNNPKSIKAKELISLIATLVLGAMAHADPSAGLNFSNTVVGPGETISAMVTGASSTGLNELGLENCDANGNPVGNKGLIATTSGTPAATHIFPLTVPAAPGKYQYDSYAWNTTRSSLARSQPITITVIDPVVSLTLSTTSSSSGQTVTATVTARSGHNLNEIGLESCDANGNPLSNLGLTSVSGGSASHTFTWTAPATAGTYYFDAYAWDSTRTQLSRTTTPQAVFIDNTPTTLTLSNNVVSTGGSVTATVTATNTAGVSEIGFEGCDSLKNPNRNLGDTNFTPASTYVSRNYTWSAPTTPGVYYVDGYAWNTANPRQLTRTTPAKPIAVGTTATPQVSIATGSSTLYAGQSTTLTVVAMSTLPSTNIQSINIDEISGPGGNSYFGPGNVFDASHPSANGWADLTTPALYAERTVVLSFPTPGTYVFSGSTRNTSGQYINYATNASIQTATITVLPVNFPKVYIDVNQLNTSEAANLNPIVGDGVWAVNVQFDKSTVPFDKAGWTNVLNTLSKNGALPIITEDTYDRSIGDNNDMNTTYLNVFSAVGHVTSAMVYTENFISDRSQNSYDLITGLDSNGNLLAKNDPTLLTDRDLNNNLLQDRFPYTVAVPGHPQSSIVTLPNQIQAAAGYLSTITSAPAPKIIVDCRNYSPPHSTYLDNALHDPNCCGVVMEVNPRAGNIVGLNVKQAWQKALSYNKQCLVLLAPVFDASTPAKPPSATADYLSDVKESVYELGDTGYLNNSNAAIVLAVYVRGTGPGQTGVGFFNAEAGLPTNTIQAAFNWIKNTYPTATIPAHAHN